MLRKTMYLMLAVCLVLSMFGAAGAEPANLLTNGGFEEAEAGGLPTGWAPVMWQSGEAFTVVSLADEANSGVKSLLIENKQGNDAWLEQTIDVTPDTLYHLSAMAKVKCDEGTTGGAVLTTLGSFHTSKTLVDTGDKWEKLEIYGRTAPEQTKLTIMVRLGFSANPAIGKVWYDDVAAEQIAEAPEDVKPIVFANTWTGKKNQPAATPAPVDVPAFNTTATEQPSATEPSAATPGPDAATDTPAATPDAQPTPEAAQTTPDAQPTTETPATPTAEPAATPTQTPNTGNSGSGSMGGYIIAIVIVALALCASLYFTQKAKKNKK